MLFMRCEIEDEGVKEYLLDLVVKEVEWLIYEEVFVVFFNSYACEGGVVYFYFQESFDSDELIEDVLGYEV